MLCVQYWEDRYNSISYIKKKQIIRRAYLECNNLFLLLSWPCHSCACYCQVSHLLSAVTGVVWIEWYMQLSLAFLNRCGHFSGCWEWMLTGRLWCPHSKVTIFWFFIFNRSQCLFVDQLSGASTWVGLLFCPQTEHGGQGCLLGHWQNLGLVISDAKGGRAGNCKRRNIFPFWFTPRRSMEEEKINVWLWS